MAATPPLPPTATTRKQTWNSGHSASSAASGGGGKRRSSSKLPPMPTDTPPSRITRSSSGHGKPHLFSIPDLPPRVMRSNTAPVPLPHQAPGATKDSAGVTVDEDPKEKDGTGMFVSLCAGDLNFDLFCRPMQRGSLPFTRPSEAVSLLKLVCKCTFVHVHVVPWCPTCYAVPSDPSLPILRLAKALYALNVHWTDLYPVCDSDTKSQLALMCIPHECTCTHTHTHTHTYLFRASLATPFYP